MSTAKADSRAESAFVDSAAAPFDPGRLDDSTRLWIVRHGETEWSLSGQHTGATDIPLTAAGERQAAALRDMLAAIRPVLVLSSPRRRAMHTAELAGVKVDDVTEDLAEWDYGDYEGLTTPQIRESVPDWTVWTHGCPGGESTEQVRIRADRALARIVPELSRGPVIVFGHGHFSRALGARWIGLPVGGGANLLLGTAAPSVLGAEHGGPAIDHWNMRNPVA